VIGDYEFRITDFKNFIEPLEKDASVLAAYSIYHKGSLIAKSAPGLVKIDRTMAKLFLWIMINGVCSMLVNEVC